MSPHSLTTTLSSALFPTGTLSSGRLGMASNMRFHSFSISPAAASSSLTRLDTSFISASFALNSSEPFGSSEIALLAAFWAARASSNSATAARLLASNASIASMSQSKCLSATLAFTSSGFSLRNFTSIIIWEIIDFQRRHFNKIVGAPPSRKG